MVAGILIAIIILAVASALGRNPKCPNCGCYLEGPFEDWRDGVWTTIYCCPRCRKEWF